MAHKREEGGAGPGVAEEHVTVGLRRGPVVTDTSGRLTRDDVREVPGVVGSPPTARRVPVVLRRRQVAVLLQAVSAGLGSEPRNTVHLPSPRDKKMCPRQRSVEEKDWGDTKKIEW